MKVRLAKTAGFCMGVRRAMELTLKALNREDTPIYSYGPLIHNSQVMDMLSNKGLRTIYKRDEWPEEGKTVIIRAHGVPPDERKALKEAGLKVINATCPRVIRVQAIIQKHTKNGYAAIIVGDAEHAEVVGLLGHAGGNGWAVKSDAEIHKLPDLEKVIVVAQTTQSRPHFADMVSVIQDRWPQAVIFNTICDTTHNRQEEVRQLSSQVQAMIVVGGHNSGNTTRLAEVSRSAGTKTIHLETEDELDPEWLSSLDTVGVTSGASTPNWMIKRVTRELERTARRRELSFRSVFRRVLRILVLSNIYIALGAASLTMAGTMLQGLSPGLKLFAVVFFYVHAMHMLNLFLDKEAGKFNDPDRALFLESHKKVLIGSGIFSAMASLVLGFNIGPPVFLLLFITGFIGLLYSIRLVPKSLAPYTRLTRLKDFPASRTLSVSIGWALGLSLIPALTPDGNINWSTLLVATSIFLLVFIRGNLVGIFDIQGDRIIGRETIPIIIGEERTLAMLNLTVILLALVLVLGWILNLFPSLALFLLIVPVYVGLYLVVYQRKKFIISALFEALVDGSFILPGLISWLWWVWL